MLPIISVLLCCYSCGSDLIYHSTEITLGWFKHLYYNVSSLGLNWCHPQNGQKIKEKESVKSYYGLITSYG